MGPPPGGVTGGPGASWRLLSGAQRLLLGPRSENDTWKTPASNHGGHLRTLSRRQDDSNFFLNRGRPCRSLVTETRNRNCEVANLILKIISHSCKCSTCLSILLLWKQQCQRSIFWSETWYLMAYCVSGDTRATRGQTGQHLLCVPTGTEY